MCIYICEKAHTFEFSVPRTDLSHSSKKNCPVTSEIGKQNTETDFFYDRHNCDMPKPFQAWTAFFYARQNSRCETNPLSLKKQL